jgi:hypothetical protein
MRQNRYNINDRVYHVTPESPVGVVIDGTCSLRTGNWVYQVAWGVEGEPRWYYENELSINKTY